jgi:HlyD family secretion protein
MNPLQKISADPVKKGVAVLAIGLIAGIAAVKISWRILKPEVFQGYVEGEYLYVAAPVAGRLVTLAVQRGDTASEGQLLYALDPEPDQQRLEEAEAALVLAKKNWDRVQELIRGNAISQQQYDQAEGDYTTQLKNADQLRWRVREKVQKAARAGYVQDTFYVKGEWVPEGRPVVSLLPPANIRARFYVGAEEAGRLKPGQAVRVQEPGQKKAIQGKIAYISSQAEYTPPIIYSLETRAKLVFLVEVAFAAEEAVLLHPGQPVDVTLEP